MGHHCIGCRVLDGHEDTNEVVKGLGLNGFLGILSVRRGAG